MLSRRESSAAQCGQAGPRPGRPSRFSSAFMASSTNGTCWYSSIHTGPDPLTNIAGSASAASRVATSSRSTSSAPTWAAIARNSVDFPTDRGPWRSRTGSARTSFLHQTRDPFRVVATGNQILGHERSPLVLATSLVAGPVAPSRLATCRGKGMDTATRSVCRTMPKAHPEMFLCPHGSAFWRGGDVSEDTATTATSTFGWRNPSSL